MVECMGMITKCYPLGWRLTGICIGLGFIAIPWGFIIKFIPLRWFAFEVNDHPLHEDDKHNVITTGLLKKSSIRRKEISGLLGEKIK